MSRVCIKGTLFDYVKEMNGLDEDIGNTIFNQILEAVEYCHGKNIYHRDIKLDNILFDDSFMPKLCDFGFAIECAPTKPLSDFVGTKCYMAPELRATKTYLAPHVDTFALGVSLFQMVVGVKPFDEASQNNIYYKPIYNKDYDRFWNNVDIIMKKRISGYKKLSQDFKNLFIKMVEFEPNNRISIKDIKDHP